MWRQIGLLVTRSLAGLVLFGTAGCGGGEEFDVVPVRGKVTCNGQPVSAGTVRFVPDSGAASAAPAGVPGQQPQGSAAANVGKSAFGVIQKDGTYVLSTYSEADGAVVGRHRVVILPGTTESVEEEEDPEEAQESEDNENNEDEIIPLPCDPPRDLFVELTPDTSVINIEMAEGGSATTE